MSGSRTAGPTLAIAAGGPSAQAHVATHSAPPPTSFNTATGAMNNLKSDYVSKLSSRLSKNSFFFHSRILHH